jgi:nitroreductase
MNEQTKNLLDAIRNRRSYALIDVAPDAINLDDLSPMLEAANWAPSHGMTEPQRFSIFTGDAREALGQRFAEAYRALTPAEQHDARAEQKQRERVFAAPVWISLGMLRTGDDKMPEWEDQATVSIAAQHIHLVAHSLGYACKWTSGEITRHETVLDLVGLKPPSKLFGFLYLGRPAKSDPPAGRRAPIDNKVIWMT